MYGPESQTERADQVEAESLHANIAHHLREGADLIITDLIMPNKDGIGMIIELQKEFPDVKIIAMSGGGRIGTTDYLHLAKIFGVQRTFTKPVAREQLLDAIKELLKE